MELPVNIVDRIQEHLSKLSPREGDTDTAWFLREAKREIEDLQRRVKLWEPSLTCESGGTIGVLDVEAMHKIHNSK